MDDVDVRRHWNANAETWTRLARAGYDVYRDLLNTPALLAMLPDVRGRRGLDLGCGEGHNTRLVARRGARMTGIDLAETFLRHAQAHEREAPQGIALAHASASALPFGDASFDFAIACMSLMDMADLTRVLAEVRRVLRPGAFLQASIEHPCYATPHRRKLLDAEGRAYAFEIGGAFARLDGAIEEWTFSAAPAAVRAGAAPFRIPRFTRPISDWLTRLADAGFVLERCDEPRPSDEVVRACPKLQDAQVIPYFFHFRARTPDHAGRKSQ